MATDVARVSFDPGRRYTDTVAQQGRVTLEAEENEQRAILAEERLRELREIVGPAGTPDDGYAVSDAGNGDLTIGAGTMYVGGLRVELDAPEKYGAQPDWRDCDGDPAFSAPAVTGINEHVVLVLAEYDVTATEDPVLREVALGGPDGSARRRILQRVRRIPTDASDCAGAAGSDAKAWDADGLAFDPATMRLTSKSRLQVVWDGPPAVTDPCEPGGSGGYLGAENQNIRVQVCRGGPGSQTFDLVWGWDNGSSLYRVGADAGTNPILTLQRAPVDDFHRPRAGQPVEVLRAAADLDSADGVTEGWAAELTGRVGVLGAPYYPDTRTVMFPTSLPAQYRDASKSPQLYLRVWEELHTGVSAGDTVTLTGTGLKVQLTMPSGARPHVGDHWSIAVRPSTPDQVLPARLLRSPQPPDGPRMWACPLAVIGWNDGRFQLIEDCRVPFPPLTGLTTGGDGCCTVSVEPQDAERLQEIIDQAAAGRKVHDVTQRITVCLKPGRYELAYPLRLREVHSELHLEGCGDGVVLAAEAGREELFGDGLVMLIGTTGIRITGITFEPPESPAGGAFQRAGSGGASMWRTKGLQPLAKQVGAVFGSLTASVALRTVSCSGLTVEDCEFRPGTPSQVSAARRGPGDRTLVLAAQQRLFLAGIFATGPCVGWTLRGNSFQDATDPATRPPVPYQISVGFLLSPSMEGEQAAAARTAGDVHAGQSTVLTDALLDSVISGNRFTALTAGVFVLGHVGDVDVADNDLTDCYGGLWFYAQDTSGVDLAGHYAVPDADPAAVKAVHDTVAATLLDPAMLAMSAIGRVYPLPEPPAPAKPSTRPADTEQAPTSAELTARFVAQLMKPAYTLGRSRAAAEEAGARAGTPAAGEAIPVDFNAGVGTRARLVAAGGAAYTGVRDLALALGEHGAITVSDGLLPPMALRIHDNRIRCTQPDQTTPAGTAPAPGRTGSALIVADQIDGEAGSVLVTGNDLYAEPGGAQDNSTAPVAQLIRTAWTTVTGNLIRRADRDGVSLSVVGAGEGAAVTGNVMNAYALLPARPTVPPPLDTWWPFNTIVN